MPKRYDIEKFSNSKNLQASTALEFIMRDVIDGMEEMANMSGFSPEASNCFRILSIESPEDVADSLPVCQEHEDTIGEPVYENNGAEIIPIKRKKQAVA